MFADAMKGPGMKARAWAGIAGRAAWAGVLGMILLPLVAFGAVLAVGHLAGACGAGSSGGCEMGAAAMGMLAVPVGLLLGVALSVGRDLVWLRRRGDPPGG